MSACTLGGGHPAEATTLYPGGRACPDHAPAQPGATAYCAPARCYCGGCPSWVPVLSRREAMAAARRAVQGGRDAWALERAVEDAAGRGHGLLTASAAMVAA